MSLDFTIQKAFYNVFGLPIETEFKIDKRVVNHTHSLDKFNINSGTPQSKSAKLGSNFYATDAYGRNYFLPVSVYYTDANGAKQDYDLPFPVVNIECGKTIIETVLVERSGSVKEIISIDDIIITIRGFMVDPNNNYPEDDVRELGESIFLPNQTVKIRCALTDIFLQDNDFGVVVKKLRFPAVTGIVGVKPYEIDLVSDAIFDLVNVPAT